DDRAEGLAKPRFAAVAERAPYAAVRRAAPRLDLLQDRPGGEVAYRGVLAFFGEKLLHPGIQQPSAELVAERIPHDRVHADQPRRKMADRKELHELHVDQLGPRAERERVAVAAHVERGAVARVEARQAAGGDDRRFRGDRYRFPGRDVDGPCADAPFALQGEIGDEQVAGAANIRDALQLRAQRLRDRGAGVDEI